MFYIGTIEKSTYDFCQCVTKYFKNVFDNV